jgi:leader peptidase (prepilin peptidase)/N-methyltransferase
VNFRQRFDHPDGGTVVTRAGERIAPRRGESRRVTVRAVGLAVWIALAVACAVVFEDTTEAIVNALGCAVLVAVSVTDLERRIIPNRIIVPALVAALVVQTARDPSLEWLVGALAAGGFFLVLALVYPAGLGMGDVKLAAFMGAWLGWDVAVALFAGSLLGMVPALVALLRSGGSGRKETMPYGPFLAAGGVVGLFFGEALLDAWLG